MIIDNVKVYTESGEFVLGGIITQGDTITAVYTEKEKEVTLKKNEYDSRFLCAERKTDREYNRWKGSLCHSGIN